MLAIDYLKQIHKIDRLLVNKKYEIEYWKSLAEGVGSTTSSDERVQSQPNPHKMESAICRYIELQHQVEEEQEELIDTRNEIIKTIQLLPDKEYTALHHIYVQHMSILEISFELKIATRTINRAHRRGLELIQEILDERRTA